MLAFINYATVKVLLLLFFAIVLLIASLQVNRNIKQSSSKGFLAFIIILFVTIVLVEAYNTQTKVYTELRRGSIFICTFNNNNYKINQSEGWKIEKSYFAKESLLIPIQKCKLKESN